MDEHAQYEIRVYAEAIYDMLKNLPGFEYSLNIFKEVDDINKLIKKIILKERKESGKYDNVKEYLKSYLEK